MDINEKALALGSKRSIIREIFEYSKVRSKEIGAENVFDFSLGNPSVNPPDIVNEEVINLVKNTPPTVLHGYTSAQGDVEVRETISNNLNERFHTTLTKDSIYMTCGAAASLTISLKALCNEKDECIVFAPFFTEYKVFIENANAKVVVSKPKKDLQPDIKDFEKLVNAKTKAVIINSPNNPSGVVYTEEAIKGICDVLKKKSAEYGKEIYLISDEPYRELVYDGKKVPFIMNYYDNSLVCYSFSKSLSLPGERIGYIAVNDKMKYSKEVYLAVCGAGRSLGFVCAPSLFQYVVKKSINAKTNVKAYKENRDILYKNLCDFGYDCVRPDGAFYLFVRAKNGDAFDFYEKAKKHEVLVVPCDDFGITGYVRIAYCVSKERIENSLPAFKKLAEEYNL